MARKSNKTSGIRSSRQRRLPLISKHNPEDMCQVIDGDHRGRLCILEKRIEYRTQWGDKILWCVVMQDERTEYIFDHLLSAKKNGVWPVEVINA